jgi:hypothetical protein
MGAYEPELHACEPSEEVAVARHDHAAAMKPVEKVLQPRLDGHLQAYRLAVEPLVDFHRKLVEETDLDLAAETRWVAIWEMSGRCLALAKALIDQLSQGWGPETVGVARVLHEGANLLMTFVESEEVGHRWREGEHVRPGEARNLVATSYQEDLERIVAELGIEVDANMRQIQNEVYRRLSQGAHNDRPGFADSIARDLREFAYGPHPDPRVRALYVEFGGELIEQIVMEVGHALGRIYGDGFYIREVQPLVHAIHAVREQMPIGADVRAGFGYG